MLELILRPFSLVLFFFFLLCYLTYQVLFCNSKSLPNLPILNAREGEWFSLLRAKWRNTIDFRSALRMAYTQYKDTACILPVVGGGNMVMLPAADVQFITDQPESVLSMHKQTMEAIQADYTIPDPLLLRRPTHLQLIARDLTSHIADLVPDVSDEISRAFIDLWGRNTEWKEIGVYHTANSILGRTVNRVFIGLPLCRNQDLLDAGLAFAEDVPLAADLLRLFPRLARPLVAPLITIPNKIHTHAFFKTILPEIRRRLRNYDSARDRTDPEDKLVEPEPNDFLQWTIHQAKQSGVPYEYDPKTIAGRVLLLNMGTIHAASISITHAIFDLASHANKKDLDELREEVSSVIAAHDGQWTLQTLSQMTKLDSVLRESQRLNSFIAVGIQRLVVAKEGLTTPQGVHIPCGAVVAAPAYAMMHDSDYYADPRTFKPFRFVDEVGTDESTDPGVTKARKTFATPGVDYLPFGHGRNACPGRHFAASELKLVLAHIVQYYDLELQPSRPKNVWIGMNRLPPMKATIRIRRRARE